MAIQQVPNGMNSNSARCPSCTAPLDDATSGGLCPRCLMAGVLTPTEPASGLRASPPSVEQVAAAFPNLEVLALIGAGGMGAVFKARQPKLNRLVALKVLPASLAAQDPAFAERFEREGRMLARLHHPNIVTVYDSGQSGEFFYLLMEYVDGVNLRQAMRTSRFTPAQALNIIPRICDALQFAHDEGVLHRDVKPENILLDVRGRVKLADFGVGKMTGQAADGASTPGVPPDGDPSLTQAGASLGTPQYMAPEQRERPDGVDHRADIYSLGVVFYELLTGELPAGEFRPPSEKCPSDPRMDAIVGQALERERERRQGSAGEVRTQIESIPPRTAEAAPPPRPSSGNRQRGWKSPAWIGVALGSATLVGLLLVLALRWSLRGSLTEPPASMGVLLQESTPPGGSTLRASFPGGTLELVAVRAYPGKSTAGDTDAPWWTPSGNPSPLPGSLSSEVQEPVPPGATGYQLLVRASNTEPERGFGSGISLIHPHNYMPGDRSVEGTVVCLSASSGETEFAPTFWVGIGPWSPLSVQRTGWLGRFGSSPGRGDWTWSSGGDGAIVLEIRNLPPLPFATEWRVVAVDRSGVEHPAWQSEERVESGAPGGNRRVKGWFGGSAARVVTERTLGLDQVAEFRVEQRRGTAVTFQHVSLRPGHRTRPLLLSPQAAPPPPALAEGGPVAWAPEPAPRGSQDLDGIRREASELAARGRFEEALQRLQWYHAHALEVDPAQVGVRLSFALSQWVELARRYPRAKQALEELRDRGTREFSDGGGYFDLFLEVNALNAALGRQPESVALYKSILRRDRALARQCYRVVEELLVERKEYALCAAQIPSFQERFESSREKWRRFGELSDRSPSVSRPAMRRDRERAFVREVRDLVEILIGVGRKGEAEAIRDQALEVIDVPELRGSVEEGVRNVAAGPSAPDNAPQGQRQGRDGN
ncbi:MAG TPA: hypothetical protein DCM86_04755 [Verrucomicrobiales bacterium]|nr:hypothetical protein [Verrucomicrobiales bacterium]